MSSNARKYSADIASLILVLETMERLLKEEISVDSLYRLEAAVVEAKRCLYDVLIYANDLQAKYDAAVDKEKWAIDNPDDAKDMEVLVLPVCGLNSYLSELEEGLRKHRLTLEKILEGVPKPYLSFLLLEAKRFRDVNDTDLGYRITALRVLQRQLS